MQLKLSEDEVESNLDLAMPNILAQPSGQSLPRWTKLIDSCVNQAITFSATQSDSNLIESNIVSQNYHVVHGMYIWRLWLIDHHFYLTDVNPDGVEAAAADAEHNIYNIWRHLLDENEKIAKARLAAVQVFQDQISEDAKNLRSGKNMHAKKSLDRLNAVQKDVQQSVSEVTFFQ